MQLDIDGAVEVAAPALAKCHSWGMGVSTDHCLSVDGDLAEHIL